VTWTAGDEVSILWAEHSKLTFPDALRWLDAPSGESVAALDFYASGCIAEYQREGVLDLGRRRVLRDCADDLKGVLPSLRAEGGDYVIRLIRIAELIDTADVM
jgi:hypothetical protein